MRLDQDHPDFENTLIVLNGKWCRAAVAADDEAGWVDIPDITQMAPLDLTADPPIEDPTLDEWEEMPLKRQYGKVEFKKT